MTGVRAHRELTPSHRVVLSTILRVSLPRHQSFISAHALLSTCVFAGASLDPRPRSSAGTAGREGGYVSQSIPIECPEKVQ